MLQGDTGANTSATDNIALLHDFQPFDELEEVGVFLNNNDSTDAVSLTATGKDFIYILSDQGTTMRWETVYTPNGSETVLSPDNYLNNNDKNFYSFNHRGNRNNKGEKTFTDNNDKVLESIAMIRNWNGQWLTKNQVIMSPTISKYAIQKVTTWSALRRQQRREVEMNQQKAEDSSAPTKNNIESSNNRLSEIPTETGEAHQLMSPSNSILDVNDNNIRVTDINNNTNDTIHSDETSSISIKVKIEPPTKMKPFQQLELWHQRMGHISPRTLQETQRFTTGIPKFPQATSFFKCPFCEKSKMIKRGGKKKTQDNYIPGQVFHMDLSFVSGPSNLEDMITNNAPPEKTLTKSHDGYIGYLTIIDVSSRLN